MTRNDQPRAGMVGNSRVSFGRFSYGCENLSIWQWGEGASLTIGSFCSIAPSVQIFLGGNHRIDWITTFPFGHIYTEELGGKNIKGHPATNGDVIIGDDVWIGYGATIMSGVTIGTGAVVAANANVVKDVLPYAIVGGNPAKVIRKRFDEETVALLLELQWWNLSIDVIKNINCDLSSRPNVTMLKTLIEKYRCPRNDERASPPTMLRDN
jgi:acetyltransferase-like isoleucine patch superfamily enzyme